MLPEEACGEVEVLLTERIHELDAKIKELRAFSKSLKRLREACETSENGRCAVLEKLKRNC